MGRPFNRINIGEIYESPNAWAGSKITFEVVDKDKDSGLIEIKSSYQHPALNPTMWKKPTDRIFNRKLI